MARARVELVLRQRAELALPKVSKFHRGAEAGQQKDEEADRTEGYDEMAALPGPLSRDTAMRGLCILAAKRL